MNTTSRAIDVGYGNTKYTTSDIVNGEIPCAMFPSVAPKANASDLTGGHFSRLNTVPIEIDGLKYQVGPDALLAMPTNGGRTLDPAFVTKPEYLALARGAMAYMNVPHIDFLYVGLPVSTFEAHGPRLKSMLTGTHPLPPIAEGGQPRFVTVNECVVVPQPVGGLFDYGIRSGQMRNLNTETNLLIDPGYFTLDWVVTAGTKMIPERSGAANNGGMAAILRSIGDEFIKAMKARDHRAYDLTETILARMDNSIRTVAPFKHDGRAETLTPYLKAGAKVVSDSLAKMVEKVGSLSDIDNVIMVGGSSHFYLHSVQKLFPHHDIKVAHDSVFANIRGFQMMAGRRAEQQAAKVAA